MMNSSIRTETRTDTPNGPKIVRVVPLPDKNTPQVGHVPQAKTFPADAPKRLSFTPSLAAASPAPAARPRRSAVVPTDYDTETPVVGYGNPAPARNTYRNSRF